MSLRHYVLPILERDEDDGHILWYLFDWKEYLLRWLPAHIWHWIEDRRLAHTIMRGGQYGHYYVIPPGYRYDIIHKSPSSNGVADPLMALDTVGIKLRPSSPSPRGTDGRRQET